MGEREEGEEPLLSHKKSHGLGPTATSARFRPGHGKNDDFTASQEGQGAAGAAGGVAHPEMNGDSTGCARVGGETTLRGVSDKAGEVFRAADSADERAAPE